jgi:hypothetical protein
MDVTLKLSAADLDAEDLQDLTLELAKTLDRETDLHANLPEEHGGPGTKGDAITLGQIILTALSSGTVVALFGVLKSYFERKPSLAMELQRADGRNFKVAAEHLDKNQVNQTIKLANEFLEG